MFHSISILLFHYGVLAMIDVLAPDESFGSPLDLPKTRVTGVKKKKERKKRRKPLLRLDKTSERSGGRFSLVESCLFDFWLRKDGQLPVTVPNSNAKGATCHFHSSPIRPQRVKSPI